MRQRGEGGGEGLPLCCCCFNGSVFIGSRRRHIGRLWYYQSGQGKHFSIQQNQQQNWNNLDLRCRSLVFTFLGEWQKDVLVDLIWGLRVRSESVSRFQAWASVFRDNDIRYLLHFLFFSPQRQKHQFWPKGLLEAGGLSKSKTKNQNSS